MKKWQKRCAFLLVIAFLCSLFPMGVMANGEPERSLDQREIEDFLQPGPSPMDKEPDQVDLVPAGGGLPSEVTVDSGEDTIGKLADGIWLSEADGWVSDDVAGDHWIQVSYGVKTPVDKIVVKGLAGEMMIQSLYVEGSDDGETWEPVSEPVTAGDGSEIVLNLPETVDYRIYKIVITSPNTGVDNRARVLELEFYRNEPGELENIALKKPVEADGYFQEPGVNFKPEYLTDGLMGNVGEHGWVSTGTNPNPWFIIDLGATQEIQGFVMQNFGALTAENPGGGERLENCAAFTVEVSRDKSDWQEAYQITGNTANVVNCNLDKAVQGRYVKVTIDQCNQTPGDAWARIAEFEVLAYGTNETFVALPIGSDEPPLVVVDTKNISQGKSVEADGYFDSPGENFKPEYLTDGLWETLGSQGWVSSGTSQNPWFIIDLNEVQEICGFTMRNFGALTSDNPGGEDRLENCAAFTVEVSQDKGSWQEVASVSSKTENVVEIELDQVVKGQYVKVTIDQCNQTPGDAIARIAEFEVLGPIYGTPEDPGAGGDPVETKNVALNKLVTADCTLGAFEASNLTDGAYAAEGTDFWISDGSHGKEHWFTVDLQEVRKITGFKLVNHGVLTTGDNALENTRSFKVQVSNTGADEDWQDVQVITGNTLATVEMNLAAPVNAQYVRIYVTQANAGDDGYCRIGELEVYSPTVGGVVPQEPSGRYVQSLDGEWEMVSGGTDAERLGTVRVGVDSGQETSNKLVDGTWDGEESAWISADAAGDHYAEIVFDQNTLVNRVVVKNLPGDYMTKAFKVEGSYNGTEWQPIGTPVTDNQELDVTIEIPDGVDYRHYRVTITQPNNGVDNVARLAEVQLYKYGLGHQKIDIVGKPVEADCYFSVFEPSNLTDGAMAQEDTDEWVSDGNHGLEHWFTVDLEEEMELSGFKLYNYGVLHGVDYRAENTAGFRIQVSNTNNGEDWKTVYTTTNNTASIAEAYLTEPVTARYVRVYITQCTQLAGDGWARIMEFEVMGPVPDPDTSILLSQMDTTLSDWEGSIPAKVPGSIHTALMDAGVIEDPYWGLNDEAARAESFKTWWFKTTFDYQGDVNNAQLVFEGVCDRASFWLNGQAIGSHQGMFGGPELDVSGIIQEGENTLIVKLLPAVEDWKESVIFNCSYAWHYCIIPPLGIWQSVSVREVPQVELDHPFIATVDAQAGLMDLSVDLVGQTEGISGTLKGVIKPKNFEGDAYEFTYDMQAEGDSANARLQFTIPNPQLWWPNGLGDQNLYTLDTYFIDENGFELDHDTTSFGIRTVKMEPLAELGPQEDCYNWTFIVNGENVFMKGSGWCTLDALMRFTEERYDRQLVLAKEQGIQFLRAWGPGMPETDTFYDLCDEYGIAILQEWPTAWDSYKQQPEDVLYETIIRNTKRIRNHPSLFMYGGGNEGLAALQERVLNGIGRLCMEYDGTRAWHRQDPYGESNHNYDSYTGSMPNEEWLTYSAPFIGEFGLNTMMNMESIAKVAPAEELEEWPVDLEGSVAHHTALWGKAGLTTIQGDVNSAMYYGGEFVEMDSLEDVVLGSQIAQWIGVRGALERARTRWPNSTGICYYKMTDVYPGGSWATVDWFGSPKMAHYIFQDSYANLTAVGIFSEFSTHKDGLEPGLTMPIFLLDDADDLAGANWQVNVRAYNAALNLVKSESYEGSDSIEKVQQVGTFTLNEQESNSTPLFVVTEVVKDGVLEGRSYYYFNFQDAVGCLFNMPRTTLEYSVADNIYTIKNTGDVPAISVNFDCADVSDTFIPSDNFFWLEPGEEKKVSVNSTEGVKGLKFWNMADVEDVTAPSVPTGLEATSDSSNTVTLNWTASEDDKNVLGYYVYREGKVIGFAQGGATQYTDVVAREGEQHAYQVAAVDEGGNLSDLTEAVYGTSQADTQALSIKEYRMTDLKTITLVFNEAVDQESAENVANYALSGGASVSGAKLEADGKTVTLTANGLRDDREFTLRVSGIRDASLAKNLMQTTRVKVAYKLSAYWNFEEGSGYIVNDVTGNANHGEILKAAEWKLEDTQATPLESVVFTPGPEGKGTALEFDGYAGAVAVDECDIDFDAFTLSAYIKLGPDAELSHTIIARNLYPLAGHWAFYVHNGQPLFYTMDLVQEGTNRNVFEFYTDIRDDQWHHVALTYENGVICCYVDGEETGHFEDVTGSVRREKGELAIGRFVRNVNRIKGGLDEIRIYSRALGAEEIAALSQENVPVTGIDISGESANVKLGETVQLEAELLPIDTTEASTVVWESLDPNIATVTDAGLVTGVAGGKATIQASTQDGKYSDLCVVYVEAPAATSIELDKTSLEIQEGAAEILNATILPEGATGTITWSSSNEEVATVVNGVVFAHAAGEAEIRASLSDTVYATCTVTVKAAGPVVVPVTGIELDKETAEIQVGAAEILNATITPENATNKEVTWVSSNEEVATVVRGVVFAKAPGEATITAISVDGEFKDTCVVTVVEAPPVVVSVTGVTLDKETAELKEGESLTLTATVAPENATNKNVTWSSSDEAVATVDETGKVTAVKAGSATITVTTEDGQKTDTCVVTVKAEPSVEVPVTKLKISPYSVRVFLGEELDLDVEVTPANATIQDVTWVSENPEVATVDQNGYVVAKSVGSSRIYATAKDGSGVYCYRTVTVYGPLVGNLYATNPTVERNSWENTRVTYNLNYKALVDIEILNAKGQVVRTLRDDLYVKAANGRYATWNLKDNNGEYVPAGSYTAYVSVTLPTGELTTSATTTIVVKNPPKVKLSGYLVNQSSSSARIGYTLNTKAAANFYVYNSAGKLVFTKKNVVSPAGANTYVWDYRDANGKKLPAGRYQVNMYAWNSLGKSQNAYGTAVIR